MTLRGDRFHPPKGADPADRRSPGRRDRDRILYSSAFRRLAGITQVVSATDRIPIHNRLTHTLEVAQIGRSLAEELLRSGWNRERIDPLGGLDPDVVEAACLAHDLGHPPFGHGGEDALSQALADVGGFDHNAHTLRLVTVLENPYPDFDGLNLSWEMLEGLAKHNGPVSNPSWAMVEADAAVGLELLSWPSLEAQIAAIADDIAYDNHDIDDGLRSGILDLDVLLTVPFIARQWAAVEARHPGLDRDRKIKALVRDGIGAMVGDVLAETRRRIAETKVQNLADVRAAGCQLVGFSVAMDDDERALKRHLYDNLYDSPPLTPVRREAQRIVADLATTFRERPDCLPAGWQREEGEMARLRGIGDYIAGMTDRFAIAKHEELIGPVCLPDRF